MIQKQNQSNNLPQIKNTGVDTTLDDPIISDRPKVFQTQHVAFSGCISESSHITPLVFVIKKPNYSNDEDEDDSPRIETSNNDSDVSKKSNDSTDVDEDDSPRIETPINDSDVSSKQSEEKEEVSNSDSCK